MKNNVLVLFLLFCTFSFANTGENPEVDKQPEILIEVSTINLDEAYAKDVNLLLNDKKFKTDFTCEWDIRIYNPNGELEAMSVGKANTKNLSKCEGLVRMIYYIMESQR